MWNRKKSTIRTNMIHIETEIQKIHHRNKRVEQDKAWETSLFRKIIISLLTYGTIVLFFIAAELPRPYINAVVPTVGFILSTLSLSLFRYIWSRYIHKDHR